MENEITEEQNENYANSRDVTKNLSNEQRNCKSTTILKYFNCSNYNNLLVKNEKLQKEIEDLKTLQEERLHQQAEMFRTLTHNNEIALKKKLEMLGKKNKVLNKTVQRKG
ncbi:hypothetical protein P5V15_009252 [Pogonomyrmex californicus]